ncbi:hypothetical protein [Vulcanisaeta thermophila]|uniref:hypothetical protein n=1 Tax=Vulcanisaeta thermophila TaxID=867917 RepID=UPI000852ADD5|nr:hypothetical protein [Vulcanisaeta thermophila]
MDKGLISIGTTANYYEYKEFRDFLRDYVVKEGYSITFFHPLRVFESSKKRSVTGPLDRVLNDLIGDVLGGDEENFVSRLEGFSGFLKGLGFGGFLRVLFHTDYSAPLWCDEKFRAAYLKSINNIVSEAEELLYGFGFKFKFIVEVHPGFTRLDNCSVEHERIICRRVERDVNRLKECLNDFKGGLGPGIELILEPRAGSVVRLGRNRESEPQTISDYSDATIKFARELEVKLVLDPGQSIKKKKGSKAVWDELKWVVERYPGIVGEFHVHSPEARELRGHGLPSDEELGKFAELIKSVLSKLSDANAKEPVGVIYEVMNVKTGILIDNMRKLLELLNGN